MFGDRGSDEDAAKAAGIGRYIPVDSIKEI